MRNGADSTRKGGVRPFLTQSAAAVRGGLGRLAADGPFFFGVSERFFTKKTLDKRRFSFVAGFFPTAGLSKPRTIRIVTFKGGKGK
jgi:hypothetical protein